MPRLSRKTYDGIICHNMVQGIDKEYIFNTDEQKRKYLMLMQKYYKKFNVDIIAYCIMDNHTHILSYSEKICNVSNFMKQINSQYALYYNKTNDRVGYVFRNRFKTQPINSERQLQICLKYIHMNPVKANIVKSEEEYKYSSYHEYLNCNGFISNKIINLVFGECENYIEKLKSIKCEEKDNLLEELVEDFLKSQNVNREQILVQKDLIQKLIIYLKSSHIKFSNLKLAEVLNISRATFYRKLK